MRVGAIQTRLHEKVENEGTEGLRKREAQGPASLTDWELREIGEVQ